MREDKVTPTGKEIQLVVFRLWKEEFGFDISEVKEIIRIPNITPMPKSPAFIEGIINLRGQIIAVIDLAKRFNLFRMERTEKSRIIVAEVKENIVGFIVDEVPEVLRITGTDIDSAPQMIESKIHSGFIKGVGKLKDRLIILLDLQRILSHDEVKEIEVRTE